uniref:TIL domain containing protein n=1 Tax=Rhipicephalus zambeziensis TaxID=60191 RepID=A0A224YHQ0_9ACAR
MAFVSILAGFLACCALLPAKGQRPEPLAATSASSASPLSWLLPNWGGWSRRCPWGEVYKECQSGSCGEKKCYQIGQRRPLACTLDCVTGCFCMRPLYRNDEGQCVVGWRCRKSGNNRPRQTPPSRGPE